MKVLLVIFTILCIGVSARSSELGISEKLIEAEQYKEDMAEILGELDFVPEVDPETGDVDAYAVVHVSEDGYFAKMGFKFGEDITEYDEFDIHGPKEHKILLKEAIRDGLYSPSRPTPRKVKVKAKSKAAPVRLNEQAVQKVLP